MAIVKMPKLSDTMSEGKILSWKKKEGDRVKPGEVLAEIESDKATMEMEATDPGYVRKILVAAGAGAPVGVAIAIVTSSADEDIATYLAAAARGGESSATHAAEEKKPTASGGPTAPRQPAAARAREPAAAAPVARPVAAVATAPAPAPAPSAGRLLASPLAARMAGANGLELSRIQGSGPRGRVVKRDILRALAEAAAAPALPPIAGRLSAPAPSAAPRFLPAAFHSNGDLGHEDLPVSSMRRIIGSRLVESKAGAPHFYVTVEVDMKRAIAAREDLKKVTGLDITYNDLVVKAVAIALTRHPDCNASWQGDTIRRHRSVDIGVAVALPDGLLTPVVRACHQKSLGRISLEIKELVEKAKSKTLTPPEYQGGTFTISNLGMFGVKHFTAIINPPEACILAVGAIQSVPVVEEDAVVPGHRMSLTLSSDHRVVDGALAAQLLRDVRELLENPIALSL